MCLWCTQAAGTKPILYTVSHQYHQIKYFAFIIIIYYLFVGELNVLTDTTPVEIELTSSVSYIMSYSGFMDNKKIPINFNKTVNISANNMYSNFVIFL